MDCKLENREERVLFVCDEIEYELRSHPYEPCLYIYKNEEMIKILHNAFEVYDLVEMFETGETVTGPDSKIFDQESFCRVLSASISDSRYEMNWTFAARLAEL